MGDPRDQRTWVAVELTKQGEIRVIEGTLEQSIRQDMKLDPSHSIFIPVALHKRKGRVIPTHLMEGYCFIASGLDEVAYYALENTCYVQQVISTYQGRYKFRYLSTISDDEIQKMQLKLRQMVTGDIPLQALVDITDGLYQGLSGRICGLDEKHGYVRITLRSLDVVATIPRIFLDEVYEE